MPEIGLMVPALRRRDTEEAVGVGGVEGQFEAGKEAGGGDGAEGEPVVWAQGRGGFHQVGAAGDGVEGSLELPVYQLRGGLQLRREHGLARFGGDERRQAGSAEGG